MPMKIYQPSLYLAFGLLIAGVFVPKVGYAYFEDLKTDNLENHSTFHYEFTRTLARAAGFNKADADLIATADEATDAGTFTGGMPTSRMVKILGTDRTNPEHYFWHYPRRGPSAIADRNTCDYFIGTTDECADNTPELDSIIAWANSGTSLPAAVTPLQYSINAGDAQDISGQTLIALGVYLHSLADSYSHEACMKVAQSRDHAHSPVECQLKYWHLKAEYGNDPTRDVGTSYTKEAGREVWLALLAYRSANGLADSAAWDTTTAHYFIDAWVAKNKPEARHKLAVKFFKALNK